MRRPNSPRGRAIAPAALLLVTLALVLLMRGDEPRVPATAPAADEGLVETLIRRFTRQESVSIRIDAERRMSVHRPDVGAGGFRRSDGGEMPDRGSVDDWLVLDHRWLGTGRRAGRDTMSYVGASMGADAHVTVTPPFVVLTRGTESILLRMEAGRAVSVDQPMPEWVRSDPESGLVVARFDGFGDARIGDGRVRLQRRFFGW